MSVALPKLRVGDPIRHDSISIFPLFANSNGAVDYQLAEEAVADQSVTITEVSEAGSVPELLVENRCKRRILFLEGDELKGAKQNRVLNTSVLIAALSKNKIPVSCVERGRWRFTSGSFGYSGTSSPFNLRSALKGAVARSLRANLGHRSDQGEVWGEVAKFQACLDVASPTDAMADAYETYGDRLNQFREKVKYINGANGLAIAVGERLTSIDVFDKPETCEKVWPRLLSGLLFEIVKPEKPDTELTSRDVEQTLDRIADLNWQQTDAVGDGIEYRAESERGDHASSLVLDDTVVHGSWIAGRG